MIVAHKVMQAMRSRDFRNDMGGTNSAGEHVIVPALPDDTIDLFFDRVRSAQGTVYVAMLEGDNLVVLNMAPARAPKHAVPQDDDSCGIQRHAHLAMVVEYLRAHRTPVTFYEAPCNVMLELVDEGPSIPSLVP